MKIILFPFSGGDRHSYRKVYPHFPAELEIIEHEYPGRGLRYEEPFLNTISEIVEDAYVRLKNHFTDGDYCFYGHSLGALVAFLMCKKIQNVNGKPPLKLFVSGRVAPSVQLRGSWFDLTEDDFLERVSRLGALPKEILDRKKLRDFYLPVLRSDFKIYESFVYEEGNVLSVPIDVFYGTEDVESVASVHLWERESSSLTRVFGFPGNHFFIFNEFDKIAACI